VSEVYGAPGDYTSGAYSNVAQLLNRSWVDDNGVAFTSSVQGLFDAMAGVDTVDNAELEQALRGDNPIVMGTTSHAMLILNMSYSSCTGTVESVGVFDPWPGMGLRYLSEAEATPVSNGGTLAFLAIVSVT